MAKKTTGTVSDRDSRLPDKSVLQLRRTDAGLRVVGEAPSRHVFTPGFVERELANGASLRITVPTREGDSDLVYELVGFEQVPDIDPKTGEQRKDEDGNLLTKPNLTSWICDKVED